MGFQDLPRTSRAIHATEGEVWVGKQFHLFGGYGTDKVF
jgi:hypothetical protein